MRSIFWVGVGVLVVGLFMLVAGIGPLWLPIAVIVVGVVVALVSRNRVRQNLGS
jgi:membrane protein implicated in regulation of membrane protease activity